MPVSSEAMRISCPASNSPLFLALSAIPWHKSQFGSGKVARLPGRTVTPALSGDMEWVFPLTV